MKKRTDKDILDLISDFKKSLDKKPPFTEMYEEVQMMKFKVRPIQGDLSAVNLNNEQFVKTLWSLGKLDEFFQKEFYRLTAKNKDLFMKVFDDIYAKYQQDLNRINLHWERIPRQSLLEVEIFKEAKKKKTN
ncbi:MAG: hypothetical protein US40_C0003G0008 [Candidatus Roizmanbacteria bacterium GW2011_GWC2_37_13]|uniref:Uncharacterized protein n=1 Tax=Candidatus Roizmanbacteria bacterium GW2011_GWC2_37_13 TaxID=1618486 RepID=A0A0G0JDB1_9BACT|nr:MAG: hypothetical protein US38_C0004G0011 [Candidatus Roizmanbacteria bacterium GW2011_GWC1_37_12]KKQ26156.1 MAG: hypothetical protein US40_C0003G0008 [Candidatus Roizmanbacteria bacterium GW2011_GWC2_37_13]